MGTRFKNLSLIIAVQFACVSVGFWVQQQFLSSFSDRTAGETVWAQIETESDSILQSAKHADLESLNIDAIEAQLRSAPSPQPWQITLVDSDWTFVRDSDHPSIAAESTKNIMWQPIKRAHF